MKVNRYGIFSVQISSDSSNASCPSLHRENCPITQSTPEPTLSSWGGWPCEKQFRHPWPLSKPSLITVLSCLSGHWDRIVLEFFDVSQVCHEYQIRSRFHWIWKIILEMAFSAHCISIWNLNRISRTSISKIAPKCIWYCSWVQWCATAPRYAHRWGKIVQWSM